MLHGNGNGRCSYLVYKMRKGGAVTRTTADGDGERDVGDVRNNEYHAVFGKVCRTW